MGNAKNYIIHGIVIFATVVAVVVWGRYVFYRPQIFKHWYAVFYLFVLAIPILLHRVTGIKAFLHIAGIPLVLLVLFVLCKLTPEMDSDGETLESFDRRMSKVTVGWKTARLLSDIGPPTMKEAKGDVLVWKYRWCGMNEETRLGIGGNQCVYIVSVNKSGEVSSIRREMSGWDILLTPLYRPSSPW